MLHLHEVKYVLKLGVDSEASILTYFSQKC